MVITVQELKALTLTTQPPLHIKQVIVDFAAKKVFALRVHRTGLFSRSRVISYGQVARVGEQVELLAQQDASPVRIMPRLHGELIDKEVFTEKKRYLGRVATYKLDTGSGEITALWVRTPVFLRDLWRQTLVIARNQVLSIDAKAVIVDEAIIKNALKPAATAEVLADEASLGITPESA
jgi:sporulation protein YlmC with PRC-barrel domain